MAFIVLRVLSYFNRKRRWISVNGEQRDIPTSKLGCTKIYNAKDIVEAGRIVELTLIIGYNTSSKIKYRTSGARNNEKWGMKNGKRHIVFWRIKKY